MSVFEDDRISISPRFSDFAIDVGALGQAFRGIQGLCIECGVGVSKGDKVSVVALNADHEAIFRMCHATCGASQCLTRYETDSQYGAMRRLGFEATNMDLGEQRTPVVAVNFFTADEKEARRIYANVRAAGFKTPPSGAQPEPLPITQVVTASVAHNRLRTTCGIDVQGPVPASVNPTSWLEIELANDFGLLAGIKSERSLRLYISINFQGPILDAVMSGDRRLLAAQVPAVTIKRS